jgi:hypothetical protein
VDYFSVRLVTFLDFTFFLFEGNFQQVFVRLGNFGVLLTFTFKELYESLLEFR